MDRSRTPTTGGGVLLATTAVALLAACTGPTTAPAGQPTAPAATTAPPTATASATGTPAGTPAGSPTPAPEALRAALECLQGVWTMDRFALGTGDATATEGRGGDVAFGFEDGRWWLSSTGDEDVTVSIGHRESEISVAGSATGSVVVQGDGVRYTVEESEGTVAMELPEGSPEHGMPLEHLLGTMVPAGGTDLECDDDEATISSRGTSVRQVLQLRR
ncbi:hypothetical protein GC722_06190 [Auraticoccus sp. F435]|uniref:Lipocalin-like domain-containing protein n=1 Tax=Auraticoccus cholistanensis TaxID=2656650 RepID=A0A6A9URT0_9ACTN|nr:hypothetical protein [Auraticoccus cholistanensis]MVA75616.1 hypothetical protein [Auraticoccus cholistanensis]